MVDTNEACKPSQRWILLVGLGSLVWARLKTVCLITILGLKNNNCFPTLKSLPAAARFPVISQSKFLSTGHCLDVAYVKGMSGMDKRHDEHVWSKTLTTNITNSQGFTFKTSYCLGHLRCTNTSCDFLRRSHRLETVNKMEWEGISPSIMDVGDAHP